MTTYETSDDRARQHAVADAFAKSMNCEFASMGPYSSFDIYLIEGGLFAGTAEVKTRTSCGYRDKTGTIPLDIDKWLSLVSMEIALRKPSYFVVSYPDGIYWVRIGSLNVQDFELCITGRNDRPDAANDKRPFMRIPIYLFTKVGEAKDGK